MDKLDKIISKSMHGYLLKEMHATFSEWDKLTDLVNKGYLIHGTSADFLTFDKSYIKGGTRAEYGYGMYFSNEVYKALEYGNEIYFTKADLYTFMDLDKSINEMNPLLELKNDMKTLRMANHYLDEVSNIREYDYYNDLIESIKAKYDFDYDEKTISEMFDIYIENNPKSTMEEIFKTVRGKLNSTQEPYISTFLLKCGYDGVKCGNQFVIFNFEKLNQNLLKEEL